MTSEQQRKLGAFYTPQLVTDCLSYWAIRQPSDTILEPSFGGCNFLTSSVKVLKKLGSKNPFESIYGFDIDLGAFEILQQNNFKSCNFVFEDFLSSAKENTIQVNVVLGNPPYLPIHKLKEEYKIQLFSKFKKYSFKIPRKSSLWVYFIVHSFRYLRPGGRMAWVVPDSICFTSYGKAFLNQLSGYFTDIKVIRVEERYFVETGTNEKTSFLLCDGFCQGTSNPVILKYGLLSEALQAVKILTEKPNVLYLGEQKVSKVDSIHLNNHFKLMKLGELFYIKIGIVIGATSILILNKEAAENSPFHPNYTYPIITKGKQLQEVVITREKLCSTGSKYPLNLIDGIKLESENPELFNKLLNSIPEKTLLNSTFRKRGKLFGYDDFNHPDAFLTFFAQGLPKFVINQSKELNCTNSVHRLYLKPGYQEILLKFTALQFFSELFAEDIRLLARPYGNLIQKFEPSDAYKIPVLVPRIIDSNLGEKIETHFDLITKNFDHNKALILKKDVVKFIKNLVV